MATGDPPGTRLSIDRVRRFLDERRTVAAVLGIALLALLARLVLLGDRIAHFDEARVAYWAMHYLDSGEFHYRYIIHGPLVQHVDRWLFAAVGANDFTMRLPVAVIGGLLPASVLLFREHLGRTELVGAAVFLAFNPILLYYSRFFRSTLPAIAFAFVAFGLIVRGIDTRQFRYVHAAVAFVAFAFAAKENAIVYLLVWVGATVLILDHVLFRPNDDRSGLDVLRAFRERAVGESVRATAGRVLGHALLASFVFLAVSLFFYAPRAGSTGGVGLWKALGNPGQLPTLIDVTLHGSRSYPAQPGVVEGYEYWLGGGVESGGRHDSIVGRYLTFGGVALKALGEYATPLLAFGIFGFLYERYARDRSRYAVLFASYWGVVSLLGFPLGSDIANAWITVNGLVPLALPAGVGLAAVFRRARTALTEGPTASSIVAALLVCLALFSMGYGAGTGVYANDQSETNSLVQYAQPADDVRPVLHEMKRASKANDGLDVLFFGDGVVAGPKKDTVNTVYPACSRMVKILPLPWYMAIYDSNATCIFEKNFSAIDREQRPPIVVTKAPYDHDLQAIFGDYVIRTYYLRALGGKTSFLIAPEYATGNGTTDMTQLRDRAADMRRASSFDLTGIAPKRP